MELSSPAGLRPVPCGTARRSDAGALRGTPTPIDADLATDGVDEILVIMLAGDWPEDPDDTAAGQRVTVATGGRTWLVGLACEAVTVTEGDGASDATVEGDPSDVVLWLWGRAPDDRVMRSGDGDALHVLRSRLALAAR